VGPAAKCALANKHHKSPLLCFAVVVVGAVKRHKPPSLLLGLAMQL